MKSEGHVSMTAAVSNANKTFNKSQCYLKSS